MKQLYVLLAIVTICLSIMFGFLLKGKYGNPVIKDQIKEGIVFDQSTYDITADIFDTEGLRITDEFFMTIQVDNTIIVEIPLKDLKSLSVEELQNLGTLATFGWVYDQDVFMYLIHKLAPNRFIVDFELAPKQFFIDAVEDLTSGSNLVIDADTAN